jgi:hypothetical protein
MKPSKRGSLPFQAGQFATLGTNFEAFPLGRKARLPLFGAFFFLCAIELHQQFCSLSIKLVYENNSHLSGLFLLLTRAMSLSVFKTSPPTKLHVFLMKAVRGRLLVTYCDFNL